MEKKDKFSLVYNIIIAVLSAVATALGLHSCDIL
jgi:hypothetical protein